jgi:hypothetical protein
LNDRFTINAYCFPYVNRYNIQSVKNILIADYLSTEIMFLKDIHQFFLGFVITNTIIVIIGQINLQFKNSYNIVSGLKVQQLDSIKYYCKVLTHDISCLFFRNCLAVIDSIIVNIDEYLSLSPFKRREKFLQDVESLNNPSVPARLFINPKKDFILIHRKGVSLKIRSTFQMYSIYKFNVSVSKNAAIFNTLRPSDFISFLEYYSDMNINEILINVLNNYGLNDISLFLVKKIFYLFDSDKIFFNEFIGVDSVPLEYFLLFLSKKYIIRARKESPLKIYTDFEDFYIHGSFKNILKMQQQKIKQNLGFKTKSNFFTGI